MENIDDTDPQFPLIDAIDHDILMHRDVHFGGQFSVMLDYYRSEGKGSRPEFSVERIVQLDALQSSLKQDLAHLFLSGSEIEKIADAKTIYKRLRSLYEMDPIKFKDSRLIADLILSEDEEAEAEVQAVVAEKNQIVPSLIELLKNELLYDPVYPGYGLAPDLAVKCLGLIGDKRAIITLFESFGRGDFFTDDQILKGLKSIGNPAKEFLLRVVKGRPINEDNERAAIALIHFKEDQEVAAACLSLLKEREVQRDPCLSTYLTLVCEGLSDPEQRAEFKALVHAGSLPHVLRDDVRAIIKAWEISDKALGEPKV